MTFKYKTDIIKSSSGRTSWAEEVALRKFLREDLEEKANADGR